MLSELLSMNKHIPAANGADTACSILASAFGEKYYGWISLPLDNTIQNTVLKEEQKKKLQDLIKERDHYEIKQTIKKLKSPS